MLQHAHRHEDIGALPDIAIIVFDEFDPVLQTLGTGAVAREFQLFLGDVECAHFRAIAPADVQRQASPAASGLNDAIARRDSQLAAYVLHLGDLRLLEGRVGARVIGAGVGHGRAEPQRIKVVAQIVMPVDVVARSGEGVAARAVQPAGYSGRNGFTGAWPVESPKYRLHEPDQIAFDFDLACAVGIAEAYLSVPQQAP